MWYVIWTTTGKEEQCRQQILKSCDGEVIAESVGVKVGQSVVITDGPMQGMEGMIKYIDRHKRMAVIEMDLFGRVLEMKLGLEVVK